MYYCRSPAIRYFTMLAEENRINMRLLSPLPGQILDRFGVPLVNQQNFRVVMVSNRRARSTACNLISEIVPLTAADFRRITREIQRKRASFRSR